VDERARGFLAAHREKILFLIVGGWNTVFQYAVFALCWHLLSAHLHPSLILLISYLIAAANGFLGFRYIVFRSAGHPLTEFLRFQAVYVPLLVLNMIGLPLLLDHTRLSAYVIQALFAVFVVVVSYLGNKYFTFRKRRPATGPER